MITALVNRKGGVAKTTTTMNLGLALSKFHRKKVLLIDLDPQGNLSTSFGFKRNGFKRGTNLIFVDGNAVGTCIYDTDDGVSLIPADDRLDATRKALSKIDILSNALQNLNFDHILIDCSPSKDILTENAIFSADQVIMPMGLDGFSADGINSLIETIDNIKQDDRYIDSVHVLFTNFEISKTLINSIVEQELKPYSKIVFKTRIRKDANVVKAQMAKASLFEVAKHSNASADYQDLAKEFLKITRGAK